MTEADPAFRRIDDRLINSTLDLAAGNARRRLNVNFHEYPDPVQRMLNCAWPDSYFHPHRHDDPSHVEVILVVRGRALVFLFEDTGQPRSAVELNGTGPCYGVEVPPTIWHSLLAIGGPTAFYEVAEGPFRGVAHAEPAPWAPRDPVAGVTFLRAAAQRLGLRV
ncbi:MAG: WbuC family cupin fold metalloprotein [Chloroflexi bacterium]|nr:WbuC family cupin fold metalloprotein [Chloroflexota bacterium]